MKKSESSLLLLAKAMGLELVRGAAILSVAVLVLGSILSLGGDPLETPSIGDRPWWLVDADGLQLLDSFPSQAMKTLGLVLAALGMTLPFALLISLLVVTQRSLTPIRLIAMTFSGAPVFVLAYAFVGSSTPFFMAATTLAIADLGLSGAMATIEPVLKRELASDHARGAKAKGASLLVHLWRPVLVAMLLSLRTRLPVLFAATVVAERIFNIPGLGDQAAYAVLERHDPVFLMWFAVFTVLVTRMFLVFAKSLEALFIPIQRTTVFSQGAISSLLSGTFTRSNKPNVEVNITLKAAPTKPRSLRRRQSLDRFWGVFGLNSGVFQTRILGWLLVVPIWLLAALVLLGALFVDSGSIYGEARNLAPFQWKHWLGTDGHERDVLVQILLGARYAIPYWFIAVFIPTIFGLILGTLASLRSFGPILDLSMEALDALPKLIIVLLSVSVLGVDRYVEIAYPVMGILFTPFVYVHVRARVKNLVRSRFVEAEQVAGASALRTLFVHVVWSNLRGVVLSCAAYVFGGVVLLDATCGYLQIAQRELCAWGALVFDNVQAWKQWYGVSADFNQWSVIAPMLAASSMILAWTYLGDGLTAAFSHEDRS
jgi:ABC-type dipeptide/oligopeptide/nickel transport system permease subunit